MALVADDPTKTAEQTTTAAGYTPAKIETDPTTDTVEGRVSGIIDKNSDLMKSAANTANAQMNSRGLLNSSIAVGAGQKAVIDTALPIAQQDAAGSLAVKTANVGAENEASRLKTVGQQNLDTIAAQGSVQERLQSEKGKIDLQLQTLQGTQAKDIAELDNKYRVLINTSANAADIYNQNSASIGAILADPKLSATAKEALVSKQIEVMNNGLALIGAMGDVDLSNYFATTAPAPATTPAPQTKAEKKAAMKAKKLRIPV